ncbi:hypothetical protein PITC_063880 [Penicillium italicum]|uniref:Uncharacterized protein n=1 Tax=Penicillium italicum TaxID=40296 RepID=A0A0A2KTF1_PENIT|nr:hypothetical protein PITC_063880 [Penicillium italicum]
MTSGIGGGSQGILKFERTVSKALALLYPKTSGWSNVQAEIAQSLATSFKKTGLMATLSLDSPYLQKRPEPMGPHAADDDFDESEYLKRHDDWKFSRIPLPEPGNFEVFEVFEV